jgi:2-hydroxychromene-2-carboxylate isomerase
MNIIHYFDYKSPYAYLAQGPTFRLAAECNAELVLIPYTLDIPGYLGRAELDADGKAVVDERTPHQWRRVRYAYMDCRREATLRGLVIRGPRKIYDTSIAHIAFLFAQRHGDPRPFHDSVFELFWKRQLDVENPDAIAVQLAQAGIDPSDFPRFLRAEGRSEHDRLRAQAEAQGVFGVPSYIVADQLYWGSERLPRIRDLLESRRRR